MRIFLVEDNLADVMLIREAIRRQSLICELDVFANAEDAMNAARSCGNTGLAVPDLILLDFNLPRGDGRDVLAAAAENPKLADVPKAMLSSFLRPEEKEQARQLGAAYFITKPATLGDFLNQVGAQIASLLTERGGSLQTSA